MRNDAMSIHRAVVTGPTGVVGLALVNELLSQGCDVFAVCRPDSSRANNLPISEKIHVVHCALDRIDALPEMIEGPIDAFFHLGWDGTRSSSHLDWKMQTQNVMYSLSAAMSARQLGAKVFLGVGSQSEMGHVEGVLRPSMPCHPYNGYGAAKVASCEMTKAYCESVGIRHIWCRILSLYGPGDAEYTLVMSVIRKLLTNEHVSCTRCDQIWEYTYSADAALALRLAAELGANGATYIVGTGKAKKLKEYVEDIKNLINTSARIGYGELPYYTGQPMHLEADISALTADTGYLPRYTFEQGVQETIDWVAGNLGGAR